MSGSHDWAVELDAFGKSYAGGWTGGRRWALHDFNLRVAPGEVVGLLGPNGSGKSTILKALAGLATPTVGSCRILGREAGGDEARANVGYLPESVRFHARQTGRELLCYCAGLATLPPSRIAARVDAVLAWSGLEAVADRRVSTYSKGMRQRLGLAQAIVHEPAVVLLDEPASGLDPEGRLDLIQLIRGLARQGRTVVFSSHLLAQAEQLCDRIALLGGGRLLAEGSPAELLGGERAPATEASPLEKLYLEKIRGPRC
ncbi:MAG: ABC transporter ATP-binding protein [Lacunisphaera sp.]